jgi:hypothetical protein
MAMNGFGWERESDLPHSSPLARVAFPDSPPVPAVRSQCRASDGRHGVDGGYQSNGARAIGGQLKRVGPETGRQGPSRGVQPSGAGTNRDW